LESLRFLVGSLTHTLPELLQVHKKIELSGATSNRLSILFVELYKKGLSLSEIAAQSGKAKNTIRSVLLQEGIELRPPSAIPVAQALREPGKRNIRPYYGFCYFQGQVVPDQREYDHLLKIYRLWKKGTNPNANACHLNAKKVPPRSASIWNRNSVVNILKRFQEGAISLKGATLELC
jgi:hypothetical protein